MSCSNTICYHKHFYAHRLSIEILFSKRSTCCAVYMYTRMNLTIHISVKPSNEPLQPVLTRTTSITRTLNLRSTVDAARQRIYGVSWVTSSTTNLKSERITFAEGNAVGTSFAACFNDGSFGRCGQSGCAGSSNKQSQEGSKLGIRSQLVSG
jgi:hypothetical protein